jgi:hypothetical protein
MADNKKCAFCLNEITSENDVFVHNDEYWHKECAKKQGIDTMTASVKGSYSNQSYSTSSIKQNATNILHAVAWLNLIFGVLGAIIIWNKFAIAVDYSYMSDEYDPIGVTLSIIFLIEGIFGWALFYVVAFTADNVNSIKEHLKIK